MKPPLVLVALLAVFILAACESATPSSGATSASTATLFARAPVPSNTPFPASTATPASTTTGTPDAKLTPYVVSAGTPTPTNAPAEKHYGTFILSRTLAIEMSDRNLAPVQKPEWLQLNSDESTLLSVVYEAYAPFTRPVPAADSPSTIGDSWAAYLGKPYVDLMRLTTEYLKRFPESDGTIPIQMMLGHVSHFKYIGESPNNGLPNAENYASAITTLFKRHPERVSQLLNDLVDLGLPISEVQDYDMGQKGTEMLLFTYHIGPFQSTWLYGSLGQPLAVVQEPGQPWRVALPPVPPNHVPDWPWPHSASIKTVADLNSDGRTDVLVEWRSILQDVPFIELQMLNWQDGGWRNDLEWQGGPVDGKYWLEDLANDGVQAIVIGYNTGRDQPPSFDVYQWDTQVRTYTNTSPVRAQLCGYHAYAEAERLARLHQLKEAMAQYVEARQRWLAEVRSPNPLCNHELYVNGLIPDSFVRQIQVGGTLALPFVPMSTWEEEFLGKRTLIDVSERLIQQTHSSTTTMTLRMDRANAYSCDVPACRVLFRYTLSATFTTTLPANANAICDGQGPQLERFAADPPTESLQWNCRVVDTKGAVRYGQSGPGIRYECAATGQHYAISGTSVITPSVPLTGTLTAYPQLPEIEQQLRQLLSCTGDG